MLEDNLLFYRMLRKVQVKQEKMLASKPGKLTGLRAPPLLQIQTLNKGKSMTLQTRMGQRLGKAQRKSRKRRRSKTEKKRYLLHDVIFITILTICNCCASVYAFIFAKHLKVGYIFILEIQV